MAESSQTAGPDTQHVRDDRGAEGAKRQPGKRPGTFSVKCYICDGVGVVRSTRSTLLHNLDGVSTPYEFENKRHFDWETCLNCSGQGIRVIDGEREGDSDRRTQPTWGDVLWFSLCSMVITALGCWLLIWRARGH